MVNLCDKLTGRKKYKTIIIPEGAADPNHANIIEVPPNLRSAPTLLARPTPANINQIPAYNQLPPCSPENNTSKVEEKVTKKAPTTTTSKDDTDDDDEEPKKKTKRKGRCDKSRRVQTEEYEDDSDDAPQSRTPVRKKGVKPSTSVKEEEGPDYGVSQVIKGGSPNFGRGYYLGYPPMRSTYGAGGFGSFGSPYGMRRPTNPYVGGYPQFDFTSSAPRPYTACPAGMGGPTNQSSYRSPCMEIQQPCACPHETGGVQKRDNLSMNQGAPPILLIAQPASTGEGSCGGPCSSSNYAQIPPSYSVQQQTCPAQQQNCPAFAAQEKMAEICPAMNQTSMPIMQSTPVQTGYPDVSFNPTRGSFPPSGYYSGATNSTNYASYNLGFGNAPRASTAPPRSMRTMLPPPRSLSASPMGHSLGCPFSRPSSPPMCQRPDCPSNFVTSEDVSGKSEECPAVKSSSSRKSAKVKRELLCSSSKSRSSKKQKNPCGSDEEMQKNQPESPDLFNLTCSGTKSQPDNDCRVCKILDNAKTILQRYKLLGKRLDGKSSTESCGVDENVTKVCNLEDSPLIQISISDLSLISSDSDKADYRAPCSESCPFRMSALPNGDPKICPSSIQAQTKANPNCGFRDCPAHQIVMPTANIDACQTCGMQGNGYQTEGNTHHVEGTQNNMRYKTEIDICPACGTQVDTSPAGKAEAITCPFYKRESQRSPAYTDQAVKNSACGLRNCSVHQNSIAQSNICPADENQGSKHFSTNSAFCGLRDCPVHQTTKPGTQSNACPAFRDLAIENTSSGNLSCSLIDCPAHEGQSKTGSRPFANPGVQDTTSGNPSCGRRDCPRHQNSDARAKSNTCPAFRNSQVSSNLGSDNHSCGLRECLGHQGNGPKVESNVYPAFRSTGIENTGISNLGCGLRECLGHQGNEANTNSKVYSARGGLKLENMNNGNLTCSLSDRSGPQTMEIVSCPAYRTERSYDFNQKSSPIPPASNNNFRPTIDMTCPSSSKQGGRNAKSSAPPCTECSSEYSSQNASFDLKPCPNYSSKGADNANLIETEKYTVVLDSCPFHPETPEGYETVKCSITPKASNNEKMYPAKCNSCS